MCPINRIDAQHDRCLVQSRRMRSTHRLCERSCQGEVGLRVDIDRLERIHDIDGGIRCDASLGLTESLPAEDVEVAVLLVQRIELLRRQQLIDVMVERRKIVGVEARLVSSD